MDVRGVSGSKGVGRGGELVVPFALAAAQRRVARPTYLEFDGAVMVKVGQPIPVRSTSQQAEGTVYVEGEEVLERKEGNEGAKNESKWGEVTRRMDRRFIVGRLTVDAVGHGRDNRPKRRRQAFSQASRHSSSAGWVVVPIHVLEESHRW